MTFSKKRANQIIEDLEPQLKDKTYRSGGQEFKILRLESHIPNPTALNKAKKKYPEDFEDYAFWEVVAIVKSPAGQLKVSLPSLRKYFSMIP